MNAGLARRRQCVDVGEARIDVIVEGEGPSIVLLPSALRDSEDFDPVASDIAGNGFTVLRPQPRGMHRSGGPTAGQTLHSMAQDVVRVVDALGDGQAVLVGHAFGHFVARVADLDHPKKVRGVVVLGAAQRNIAAGLLARLAVASDLQRGLDERLAALRESMFAAGNDPSPWLDGWHPELRAVYGIAAKTPPRDVWWPVCRTPILDLQGREDVWRPESTRNELKAALGEKVTVRVIERAGHALIPEQPASVAEAIVQWVLTLEAV